MICALSPQQQHDFFEAIAAAMWEETADPKKAFNIADFIKMIYDTFNDDPESDALALTYAQLVPSYIAKVAGLKEEIGQALRKKGTDLNVLYDLIGSFTDPIKGLDAVKNYVTPVIKKAEIKDLKEAQKKKDSVTSTKVEKPEDINHGNVEAIRAKTEDEVLKSKAILDSSAFSAVKPSLLTTEDNEAMSSDRNNENYNQPKAELIPYFHVLRTVIQKIATNDGNASKVNMGDAKGIHLSVVKASEIKKNNPEYARPDMNDNDYMLMLTDKTGAPVLFDMNVQSDTYGEVKAKGQPYLSYLAPAQELNDKSFTKGLMTNMVSSLIRAQRITGSAAEARAKAIAMLSEQQKLINDIHAFLEKNPSEKVVLDISSTNPGYVEHDRALTTPMIQVKRSEILSFEITAVASPSENLHIGDLSFTTASTGNKKLLANRPLLKDSSEYLDDILTLLFDPLYDTNGIEVPIDERRQLILPYIKLGLSTGSVNVDIEYTEATEQEPGEYRVKLDDKTVYSSLDETDDAMGKAKDMLKAAFEGIVKGSDVTLAVAKKREDAADASLPETEREKARNYLKLILPEGSAPENGKISLEDGKYNFYGHPRLNANAQFINNPYNKATIGLNRKGQVQVSIETKDYNNDYLVPTSSVPYALTGDNKIRTMNPYLIFEASEEAKGKLKGEVKKEEKVVPVKSALKEVAGNRRADLDELFAMDKRKQQKAGNQKMTLEQIAEREAEIKAWWASSPLSKIPGFTLKEAFDIANAENPNSIARFTLSGVTLYKGSDYTDLYHEAWHTFTQMFMNQTQRDAMYNEARKRSGFFSDYKGHRVAFSNASDKQLEEHLAEEFREFMLSEGKNIIADAPVKKNWFQKILDFLKAVFSKIGTRDMIANSTANQTIHDLFKNLAMHNMNGYNFSKKNAQFGHGLNQTLEAFNEEDSLQNLSLEDSRELINTVDSLMSHNLDIITSEKQLVQGSKSTKWATSIMKDPVKIKILYRVVKRHLDEIILGLNNKYETTENEEEKALIERKLNLYNWATNNFGNLDNIMSNRPADGGSVKGLIGYHMLKSKIVDEDFKEAFFDEDIESEEELIKKGRTGYERGGNETSLKDQASKEIIFLLSGLHKVKDGKTVYVPGTEYETVVDGKLVKTGVPELEDFDIVWNTLVKGLTNTLDREIMYAKLKELAKNKDLPFQQLIDFKIGSVYNQESAQEFAIWNNFWQTFNKAYIPLLQTTLEVTLTKDGKELENRTFVVKPGRATSNLKQVERAWKEAFATKDTKFIKPDRGGVRQLDLVAVRNAFREVEDAMNNKLGFLKAVGFDLEDNQEIRKELEEGAVDVAEVWDYIVNNASWRLDEKGNQKIIIRDIKDYGKALPEDSNYYTYKSGSLDLHKATKPKQYKYFATANYNAILELQARHSAKFANFMVSNAKGDTQFEHSLNNTMSVMVNAINASPSYEELIKLPWMQHLDYRRNPRAKHSAWMKALYPDFGKKREIKGAPVVLTLENLSGIAVSIDGVFDNNASVSSAGADENSKVLMDLHNTLIKGVPELMRHSDKSTSFTMFVDKMNGQYSRGTSLYAVPGAFYTTSGRSLAEKDLVNNMFMSNLFAEYESVQISRAKKKEIKDIIDENEKAKKEGLPLKPFPEMDYSYLDRAQEFVSFKGVLSNDLKTKLYTLMDKGSNLETVLKVTPEAELEKMKKEDREKAEKNNQAKNDLKGLIVSEIYKYMDGQVEAYKKTLNGISNRNMKKLFSENLNAELTKQVKQVQQVKNLTLTDENLQDMATKAFVWNSWLHNIESTNFLYGDPAQYNMKKEEFHKRNAAFSSTGTIYAVDKSAQEFVNRVIGRGLASKLSEKDASFTEGANRAFNGTFNTAVIKDQSVRSAYIADYAKALEANERKKNPKITQEELNKKLFGVDKKGVVGDIDNIHKGALLHAYADMTEGDGQGWVSFDSYRILLNIEGIWSDKQENLYQKIIKGEQVKPEDVLETFPVQKLQYAGPLQAAGLPVTAFHKFSLVPLIPTVIENTKLKQFHEKMMREGIDYATFLSGSKVGTITKQDGVDDVYTKDRQISDAPFTKNIIFLNFLKNQLAIAPKFKEKVVFSTQLRKLIEDGLVEYGIPVDFMVGSDLKVRKAKWNEALKKGTASTPKYNMYKMYESLVDKESRIKKRELIDEIGWSLDPVTGEAKGDPQSIVDFIKREFSNKDLAEHELAFIKTDGNGNLENDLSLSLSANKIEKMLNAIVSKRLVTQKVTGEGLIQVSGSMFENAKLAEGIANATEEDKKKWGTNGLTTYHVKANGKTAAMKVKVALQGGFKYLLDLDAVKEKATAENITRLEALNLLLKDDTWLDKGDNRRLVTMTGVRIPVQGLNSMEFMEVYEFLPEEAGNIIIVPSEIVAKSGSDFDVDKLTVMMPAIAKYGDKVSLVKHDDSIKQSKAELKAERTALYVEQAEAETIYDAILAEAREAKVFKTLTEKEKEALIKLKAEYSDKAKAINADIKRLSKEWDKVNVKNKRRTFDQSVKASNLENEIAALNVQKDILYKQFTDNKLEYKDGFFKGKEKLFKQEESKRVKEIQAKIQEIDEKIDKVSTKGVENDLINAIVEILSHEDIFADFITPNSTDATQPLADTLSEDVSTYKTKKKGEDSIEGTRIFEYEYNLYKHQSNKVGKEVLGIGAVDNTFNIIFNRVGAYLRSKVDIKDSKGEVTGQFFQKLYMKHNTVKDADGDAISLANLTDADNNYKISDIISQLMNGWVDVAKDAWIFNLQGNKELGPVLLFLVQAGVPIETAAYFLSQPVIREYAKRLRKAQGAFSVALGDDIRGGKENIILSQLTDSLANAEKAVLKEHQSKVKGANAKLKVDTELALEAAFGTTMLDKDLLKKALKNKSETRAVQQMAILKHFKEILKMSDAVKNVKVNLNPDTKRSNNLYEAMTKKEAIESIDGDRLSPNLVSDIMNDTVIKSFDVQKFQIELFKDLFKLTLKPELLNSLSSMQYDERKSVGFTSKADYADFGNLYRSDFMSFIFQNKLKYFDPSNIKFYKRYDIVKESDKVVKRFTRGAVFKDGKVYLDMTKIKQDFTSEAYTGNIKVAGTPNSYKTLGMATVPFGTFQHENEYAHFVIEREYLRNLYKDDEDLVKDLDFIAYKNNVSKESPMQEGESVSDYNERLNDVAFEFYLKNKALENIWNTEALFKGENPFSDRLMRIQDKFKNHPTLMRDYPIIEALKINTIIKRVKGSKAGVSYSNITSIAKLDDVELIEDYHSSIVKLSDPNVQKVSDPEENAYISDFFRKLAIVAYLQSGQNIKSSLSITRIMPDQEYLTLMKDNDVDVSNVYLAQNMAVYKNLFLSANAITLGSLRNRFKDYTSWDRNIFSKGDSVLVKSKEDPRKVEEIPYTEVANTMFYRMVNGKKIPLLSSYDYNAVTDTTKILVAQEVSPEDFFAYLLNGTNPQAEPVKKALKDFARGGYQLKDLQELLGKEARRKAFLTYYQQALAESNTDAIYEVEIAYAIDALDSLKEGLQLKAEEIFITVNPENVTELSADAISTGYLEEAVKNNTDKLFLFDDLTNPETKVVKKDLRGNRRLKALSEQGNVLGLPVIGKYTKATVSDMVTDSQIAETSMQASEVLNADEIYAKLGPNTQSENVILPKDLEDNTTYTGKNFWNDIVPEARDMFDNKIDRKTGKKRPMLIAYRGNKKKTFLQNYKESYTVGNPFDFADEKGSREEQGIASTKKFIEWMTTGNNFGNANATKEYRQAIIKDIESGTIVNSPILYYEEKKYATHATALDYLINKYAAQPKLTAKNVEQTQFNGVDSMVKIAIDNFIKNILASGKTPVFPKEGLAQEWIGNYNVKDEITAPSKALAEQSFIYLSRELYTNFGFINKNWLEGYAELYKPKEKELAFVQEVQDFTDAEIEEFIKGC